MGTVHSEVNERCVSTVVFHGLLVTMLISSAAVSWNKTAKCWNGLPMKQ